MNDRSKIPPHTAVRIRGWMIAILAVSLYAATPLAGAPLASEPPVGPTHRTDLLPTGPKSSPPGTSSEVDVSAVGIGRVLEGALVDTIYRVGPGDRFVLGISGPVPERRELQIDLEGNLILPDAHALQVSGLTLARTRHLVMERMRTTSPRAEILLSLVEAREFRAFLTGVVGRAGSYRVSGVDRVSDLLARGGPPLSTASTRNIVIAHRDGSTNRADLQRFLNTGQLDANPFLQDGDRVTVPYLRSRVEIYGAVAAPGAYEFVPEERLSDVLRLAGGLRVDALADSVRLVRFLDDQETTRESWFATDTQDPELRPRDQVFVRQRPHWRDGPTVTMLGEFKYPMVVPIVEGESRVIDAIHGAGGFTDNAAVEEATLTRAGQGQEQLRDLEFERLKLVPIAEMSPDEYAYFKMKQRAKLGRMKIDFMGVLHNSEHPDNILLERGDVFYAPQSRRFVQVTGQVANPGNVIYDPDLTVQEYVRRAGGFAWNARESHLTLIRATTGEWLRSPGRKVRLEPGDTIWVPEKPQREFWTIVKDVMLVASQAATIVILVRQVTL